MLFESTTLLLWRIVHSLERNDDDAQWDDYLEAVNECVYELHQMSRPSRGKYRSGSSSDVIIATAFARASRAIPHVKSMNRAIRLRQRAAAIACGRAAIAEMNGVERVAVPALSPSAAIPSEPEPAAKAAAATERRKRAGQRRPAAAKRKPLRASAARSH